MDKCRHQQCLVYFPRHTSHERDAQIYHSSVVPLANTAKIYFPPMCSNIHAPGIFYLNDLHVIFKNDSVLAWHPDKRHPAYQKCCVKFYASSADIHNLRHPTLKM